jgi:hypothetical protein
MDWRIEEMRVGICDKRGNMWEEENGAGLGKMGKSDREGASREN